MNIILVSKLIPVVHILLVVIYLACRILIQLIHYKDYLLRHLLY